MAGRRGGRVAQFKFLSIRNLLTRISGLVAAWARRPVFPSNDKLPLRLIRTNYHVACLLHLIPLKITKMSDGSWQLNQLTGIRHVLVSSSCHFLLYLMLSLVASLPSCSFPNWRKLVRMEPGYMTWHVRYSPFMDSLIGSCFWPASTYYFSQLPLDTKQYFKASLFFDQLGNHYFTWWHYSFCVINLTLWYRSKEMKSCPWQQIQLYLIQLEVANARYNIIYRHLFPLTIFCCLYSSVATAVGILRVNWNLVPHVPPAYGYAVMGIICIGCMSVGLSRGWNVGEWVEWDLERIPVEGCGGYGEGSRQAGAQL